MFFPCLFLAIQPLARFFPSTWILLLVVIFPFECEPPSSELCWSCLLLPPFLRAQALLIFMVLAQVVWCMWRVVCFPLYSQRLQLNRSSGTICWVMNGVIKFLFKKIIKQCDSRLPVPFCCGRLKNGQAKNGFGSQDPWIFPKWLCLRSCD